MSSPFWKYPGVLNGRIEPICADPQGVVSVYYYGGAYYYSFGYGGYTYTYDSGYTYDYSTEEDHVFILGEDSCHYPSYRFGYGNTSYVEQATADLTDIDVVYFCWRLNTSARMPSAPRVLSSASIEFKNGGLSAYGDGAPGVVLPSDFTAGFEKTDEDSVLVIAGTASNDNVYRIAGVPWNTYGVGSSGMGRVSAAPATALHLSPGDADPAPPPLGLYKNGQVAILDRLAGVTAETKVGGVTATILGARWVAKCYVDDILRTELFETRAGRAWQRNYMAAHVAKLTGVHTLKFELSYEALT